ncbi:MAG: hypothetical protein ACJASJ_001322, partial [Candidatus Azotimanducaceae bacterium]
TGLAPFGLSLLRDSVLIVARQEVDNGMA